MCATTYNLFFKHCGNFFGGIMKTYHIRRLNVDLPIDSDEDLSSPPPNGAKFNWITLKLDLPEQSSENMTPLTPIRKDVLPKQPSEDSATAGIPMRKGSLVRSPALSPDSWKEAIAARKALFESQESAKSEAEKLSSDVELAGEGD